MTPFLPCFKSAKSFLFPLCLGLVIVYRLFEIQDVERLLQGPPFLYCDNRFHTDSSRNDLRILTFPLGVLDARHLFLKSVELLD